MFFFPYNCLVKLLTKSIGVLGHGIEGSSLVNFLKDRRVRDLKIYDEKNPEFLDFTDFSDRDVLFRSPGVSLHHPALQRFEGKIISGTDLFLQLCPTKKIIGVTGTKGKGTTSTLVARIFEEANDTVFLVGNVGNPFFTDLPQIRTRDVVVAELSSFQLWDCNHSPQISVLLRMSEDHLEVHKDFEEYREAKKNIFLHQKSGGRIVYCADCPIVSEMVADLPAEQKIPFSTLQELPIGAFLRGEELVWRGEDGTEEVIVSQNDIQLPGNFNLENVLAAIAASKLLNVRTTPLTTALGKFHGLPFRLQLIAKNRDGSEFYNDSYATNPGATIAAISAFEKPTILITGGFSKKMDYSSLGKKIANSSVKILFTIGQTGPDIAEKVKKEGFSGKIIEAENIEGVFSRLSEFLKPEDIVLFSPASASFDQFQNVKDRGEKWNTAVNAFLQVTS